MNGQKLKLMPNTSFRKPLYMAANYWLQFTT